MSMGREEQRITIPKNFAVEEAGNLREELYAMIAQGKKEFLLDFRECEFIDSTGLGVIVAVYKRCVEKGGNVRLCYVMPQIMRIFSLTRLDKVFEIQN